MIEAYEAVGEFFQQSFVFPEIFVLSEETLRHVFGNPPEELLEHAREQRSFYAHIEDTGIYFRAEIKNELEQAGVDVHELTHAFVHQRWPETYTLTKSPTINYERLCLNEGLAMFVMQKFAPEARTQIKNKILKRMCYGKTINTEGLQKIVDKVSERLEKNEEPGRGYHYGLGMLYVATQLQNSKDPFESFGELVAEKTDIRSWPELIDPAVAEVYRG